MVIVVEGLECLEMLSFSITRPSFSFTNVNIFTIPQNGFVNNFRLLRTTQAVLVRKERYDAASVLKNYFKVDTTVETVYTRFNSAV